MVAVSLVFSIPVLASSYYSLILLISSFRYPKAMQGNRELKKFPLVSILVATYNEKFVISKTLEELAKLDYPRKNLQVIIADDSTDETLQIVDNGIEALRKSGIDAVVSRRETRQGFRGGAFNNAARLFKGEYLLLLDADSIVTPSVLTSGLSAFNNEPSLAFVSFRLGHYNRYQNLITRLYALSVDLGDTLNKMGSYAINSPFSCQGGSTLISRRVLEEVGYWSDNNIADDADISCKVFSSGKRGIYMSDASILGEDPQTLEVWKKQAARVSQGWAKCLSTHWRTLLHTPRLSRWRRIPLFLFLLSPLSGLSWIIVTFISAFSVALHLAPSTGSIFSNPVYLILVSIPISSYFLAAAYSLQVQKILTPKNILLVPLLSYSGYCMLTASSVGFLNGLRGNAGSYFRTPKSGLEHVEARTDYFRALSFDKVAVVEGVLSVAALVVSVVVLVDGVWFLGLSLLGFGLLTLKSMGLSRLLRSNLHMPQHPFKKRWILIWPKIADRLLRLPTGD